MTTTVANDLVFGTALKAPVVVNLVIGCGKNCANDTNLYQSSLKNAFLCCNSTVNEQTFEATNLN